MGKGWHLHMGRELLLKSFVKTPPWSYTGCARGLDKVWGLLMPFFSPQAIFLQLVRVTDPQQCLLRGKFTPAGL